MKEVLNRTELSAQAKRALSIEAATLGKSEKDIASSLILSGITFSQSTQLCRQRPAAQPCFHPEGTAVQLHPERSYPSGYSATTSRPAAQPSFHPERRSAPAKRDSRKG